MKNLALAVTILGALQPAMALAEDDDPLKPFPLLKYGVIVGAGAGAHAVGLSANPKLRGGATTGFAYVAMVPSYWFLGDVTRAYCASPTGGQKAGDDFAIATYIEENEIGTSTNAPSAADIYRDLKATGTTIHGWELGVPARCFSTFTWLGLFAALPENFEADVRVGEGEAEETTTREMRPLVSAGLLIMPRQYVHLLVGVTVSQTSVGEEGAASDRRVLSFLFGVGTSIDAISSIF